MDENAVVERSTPENGVELESDMAPDEVEESNKHPSVSDVYAMRCGDDNDNCKGAEEARGDHNEKTAEKANDDCC